MVDFFAGLSGAAAVFAACYLAGFCALSIIRRLKGPRSLPETEPVKDAPKLKRRRRKRASALTVSLGGTAFPKGSVVIMPVEPGRVPLTGVKAVKPVKKGANSVVKTKNAAEKTTAKATTLPSRPLPKAVRDDKTTSVRR